MNEPKLKGKVILAGAGPGDPDLITVKAVRWLQQADVVLADRLVSPVILKQYVREGTKIVIVGKQAGKKGSIPQQKINELILHYAENGLLVVRLKGGDTSFFSNILDELETLVTHSIPYEIVPGVTAASGAAAYAGIPLTARGHAVAVRFLTWYKPDLISEREWQDLSGTHDTLVFYMSAKTAGDLARKLISFGKEPDMPLAVISQATTVFQRVHFFTLHDLATGSGVEFSSPSLLIVGTVVSLHPRYKWYTSVESDIPYFESVSNTSDQSLSSETFAHSQTESHAGRR